MSYHVDGAMNVQHLSLPTCIAGKALHNIPLLRNYTQRERACERERGGGEGRDHVVQALYLQRMELQP